MISKGLNGSKQYLDRSQYFDMLKREKISAMLPRSRKKSFDNCIVIPVKTKCNNECKDEMLCDECNIEVNGNKKKRS